MRHLETPDQSPESRASASTAMLFRPARPRSEDQPQRELTDTRAACRGDGPNAALVCAPVAVLNVADVFTPKNCVWLNVLYVSKRSWKRSRSLKIGMFLNTGMSKLLMPGRRNTSRGRDRDVHQVLRGARRQVLLGEK